MGDDQDLLATDLAARRAEQVPVESLGLRLDIRQRRLPGDGAAEAPDLADERPPIAG
jgi:hypothetical protein